jgi:urease accessory protein
MIRRAVLLLLAATPANAHGTLPGGGGFAAGLTHPFIAVEHLLVLLGLGAVLGRQGVRGPVVGLLCGLIAGLAVTLLQLGGLQPAILILALVMGAVLAAAIPVGPTIRMALAITSGFLVGADTDGAAGPPATIAFAGVTFGVLLIVLNAMALAQYGANRLNGVPLRVAGSWIAAATILVLAFLSRGVVPA